MDENRKILVVDDDEAFRLIIEKNLKTAGFITDSVRSGSEAIKYCHENPDTFLLLDYRLPDMTAKQVVETLSSEDIQANFVIITGYGDERLAVEMMKLGAKDYLIKDVSFLDLLPPVLIRVLQQLEIENKLVESEKTVAQMNRAYKVLSDCDYVLIRASDEIAMLQDVCKIVVESGDYRLAWVGLTAEYDEAKAVSPVAHWGYEEGYLEGLNITWADTGLGRGPTGISIRTGKPHALQNIKTDPDYAPWRAEAEKRGYASSVSLPMLVEGRAIGALNIYSHESDAFYEEEISLLMKLADNLTYGISVMRLKSEHKQSEDKVVTLVQQLNQVQKMEAIGTLAGGIAHDFNNLLQAILGYTDMARIKAEGMQGIRANLDEVLKAGDRAKELVQQILSFSRQSGVEIQSVEITPIIKEALKLLRSSMPANIEIRKNINAKSYLIEADPSQIHQIIMNLCANAYHAMKEEGGILEVSLYCAEITESDYMQKLDLEPGHYVKLSVSDTGHGMDKGTLGRIFEPYFTTKKKDDGTGLGLSVVHGIVKSCKGYITAYSEPGQGTTINIYFHVSKAAKVAEAGEVVTSIPRGNERILVVDDEEQIANMLTEMLEGLGYDIKKFTVSEEALHEFQRDAHAFDLVVTDMTMPGMSGAEFAMNLIKVRPDLPVIIMTGFSEQLTEEKARVVGIKKFVMKPVLTADIANTIRETLDNQCS